jgi:hypothetical protein
LEMICEEGEKQNKNKACVIGNRKTGETQRQSSAEEGFAASHVRQAPREGRSGDDGSGSLVARCGRERKP